MIQTPSYEFYTNGSGNDYEFTSAGPNGLINKIARFTEINRNVYNLAFGDVIDNKMSDKVVSNNGDKDLILSTMGQIVAHFTDGMPEAFVFARGVDPRRTRLYQQGINRHWDNIGPFFEIWGLLNGKWIPFEKGINYQAFVGRRHGLFTGKLKWPGSP